MNKTFSKIREEVCQGSGIPVLLKVLEGCMCGLEASVYKENLVLVIRFRHVAWGVTCVSIIKNKSHVKEANKN